MKTTNTQQEILLATNSTFCKRQWCWKENSHDQHSSSQNEQMEEACWNGLLPELLPEIMEKPASGKKLYLWQIRAGASFLQIDLSEFPTYVEKNRSIDATCFLSTMILS